METVEVVIKIPKEIYNHTQEYEVGGFNQENDTKLFMAIKKGTVLPEGHGRLIDADAYRKEMLNSREFDFFKRLDMQPTIIPANKEVENEDSN